MAERLRRWFKVPVRKGVGSIPTGVTFYSHDIPINIASLLANLWNKRATCCNLLVRQSIALQRLKNRTWTKKIFTSLRCSLVVSISACHADDQGSIPCIGTFSSNFFVLAAQPCSSNSTSCQIFHQGGINLMSLCVHGPFLHVFSVLPDRGTWNQNKRYPRCTSRVGFVAILHCIIQEDFNRILASMVMLLSR